MTLLLCGTFNSYFVAVFHHKTFMVFYCFLLSVRRWITRHLVFAIYFTSVLPGATGVPPQSFLHALPCNYRCFHFVPHLLASRCSLKILIATAKSYFHVAEINLCWRWCGSGRLSSSWKHSRNIIALPGYAQALLLGTFSQRLSAHNQLTSWQVNVDISEM